MEQSSQSSGVGGAGRDIASSYGVSKEDIISNFIFGIALAVVISVLPVLIISKTKQSKIDSLQAQYQQEVTDQLATLKKEESDQALMVKQIEVLTTALSSKVKNSSMLDAFNKNTFKRSRWTSMSLDEGTITLSVSSDSFDDMAKTTAAYRGMSSVESVKLTDAALNEETGKVDFSLELDVDKKSYIEASAPKTSEGAGAATDEMVPVL